MANAATKITKKPKANDTASILQAVNKPLTFFALVVLVVETALVVIGERGNEVTKQIVAYGTVTALILSIIVVFTLVLLPQTRAYVLGEPTPVANFAADVTNLSLSGNDYRLIRAISRNPNQPAQTYEMALTRSDKTLEQRIELLVEGGFVGLQHAGVFSSELQLSGKGRELAAVIGTIESALMDMPDK